MGSKGVHVLTSIHWVTPRLTTEVRLVQELLLGPPHGCRCQNNYAIFSYKRHSSRDLYSKWNSVCMHAIAGGGFSHDPTVTVPQLHVLCFTDKSNHVPSSGFKTCLWNVAEALFLGPMPVLQLWHWHSMWTPFVSWLLHLQPSYLFMAWESRGGQLKRLEAAAKWEALKRLLAPRFRSTEFCVLWPFVELTNSLRIFCLNLKIK